MPTGLHAHVVVAGCRNALVGTRWSNSCLGYTNGLRKHHSHLIGVPFLAVKAIQVSELVFAG